MNTTRILLTAVAALTLFTATPALAGDTPQTALPERPGVGRQAHGEGRGGGHLARLAQRLELTDAQKQQIRPLLQGFQEQRKTRMEGYRARFEALLTPEQRAKWAQFREQRNQAGGERAQRPGKGEGPFGQLGLTDQQKAQMRTLREQAQAENQSALQALLGQVQPFLNEAQRTELQQILQERQQRGGPRGQRPQG